MAALAAVVAYAAAASERLPGLVVAIGACGVALAAVALLARWPSLFPLGVAGVGGAYAVTLTLGSGPIDPRAPFVAACLFVAAECAYVSFAWRGGRPAREVSLRRLALALAAAVAAALAGALVLVAASSSTRGIGLEALGVGAALMILLLLTVLSSRASA